MAIADKFEGECRKPKDNDKAELILEGSARCMIMKITSQSELKYYLKKYSDLGYSVIINKNGVVAYPLLLIINCSCNLKRVHDSHGGSGITEPFPIDRIEEKPAICFQSGKAEVSIRPAIMQTD